MTYLVGAETLLLVLLALLVVGLLRSHAEVLRRLGPTDAESGDAPDPARLAPRRSEGAPAPDVAGVTLDGEAIQLGMRAGGPSTLLAFLSSGCDTCARFWQSLGDPGGVTIPGGGRLV